MISDAELAALCADAYLPCASVVIGEDLAANIIRRDGAVIVAFRGTANPPGWLRDLDVMPKSDPMIGYCHHGFLSGAAALMQKIDLRADDRVILTGHSLGGALAVVFGALRLAVGYPVAELVTFGAPRAGYAKLVSIWKPVTGVQPAVRQYRAGNDPVPKVPLQLLAFPYRHVSDLIRVGSPDPAEPWNCHSIRYYAAVVGDIPEAPGATQETPQ